MTEWIEYTGSDDQIDEMQQCKNGYVIRFDTGRENICNDLTKPYPGEHYWIIPDDPLREMKIRQAMTGQPVWCRSVEGGGTGLCHEFMPPFAHPDKFEYSFTPFEEEV